MPKLFLKALHVLLPLGLLGGAGAFAFVLMSTAPEVKRTEAERRHPVVDAVPVTRGQFDREVEAYGTVLPAQEVTIVPEVSGRIIEVHPALQPGGLVSQGDVLVRIDPEEYDLAIARAEGALAEAEAALEVERGRQLVAEREWDLFGKDLPDAAKGQALALREPQLRQAEARIASAKSLVEQAKLDLARTTIRAPFDALVLEESVDIGQQAAPGSPIASLAGTDTFWVQASLPTSRLTAGLDAAENEDATVRIYREGAARGEEPITGRLLRHTGQVDPAGRMAQLLIEVNDPLAINADLADHPPLSLNSYVRAALAAGRIEDAIISPRKAMRENGEVWVMDKENTLQVRGPDILWRQGEKLAVRDVFTTGDRVVVSPLADLLPGMAVRLPDETPPAPVEAST
ncbi:MAG: efflux RND transporter periplasmic adaptor subunit [Candidatus Hydrogenedentes bacterium]|nr:efflux RND transporter periplasmic adaptor subunit [Candidatus Hydrogenedentota bacterium]